MTTKKILTDTFRPLWKLYKFLILRPYYVIKGSRLIWKIRNHREVSLQRTSPLPLNECGRKILSGLRSDGIYITHIDEVFPNHTWFTELVQYANSLKEAAIQNKTKPYWMDMWDIKNFRFDFSNPFLLFSLENEVLSIANAYLEMYAKFHSVGLSLTLPVAKGTPPRQSQRWHRDIGNNKYFKMFLYLNDIHEADGPFIYVKGSQSGGRWHDTFPSINPYTSASGRIEDETLEQAIPPEDILHCTGKAGTLIFADTTGLHKGGYSTHDPRFASITTYYSHHSLELRKYRDRFVYPDDFEEKIKDLIPQARYAVKRR